MQSLLKAINRLMMRVLFKAVVRPSVPLSLRRRWVRALLAAVGGPRGIERTELRAGEVPMLRLRAGAGSAVGPLPAGERDAILYIHGGGYVLGGEGAYAGFAARFAEETGADVYLPDYRLAPEHPFPAALDDVFAAYTAMLELGHSPGRVAVVGDSAGGGLATALMLVLREMTVPAPAALVLISPWLDLTLSGASVAANDRLDPVLRHDFLDVSGRAYAGDLHRSDPRVSPLYADLRRLPPTLVQVGSDEVLLDDSTRFADRAWAAGVEVELQRFEGMWHDFQTAAMTLAISREAITAIGACIRRRLADEGGPGVSRG